MALNFPNNPGIGSVFTDTTAGFSYEWTGSVWKSFTPAAASNIVVLDDISSSFNNSTTTFDLTVDTVSQHPQNAQQLDIVLGGISQSPGTDYTINGTDGTITFTTAPNSGLSFHGVIRGTAVAIDYANSGNVAEKQSYTATAGQTAFTFTAGYTTGYLDVFRNGIRLISGTDFTETNTTTFTLAEPAQVSDEIAAVGYKVASLVSTSGQFQNLNISGIGTIAGVTTANATGVNVTGIITATTFSGDGGGLTGVASTDNITTSTRVRFLDNLSVSGVSTLGSATTIGGSGIHVTGIVTATNVSVGSSVTASTFFGSGANLTALSGTAIASGTVAAARVATLNQNTTGTAGGLSGTPDIAINNVTGVAATFTGNVTIGGTISYEDVTNVDSLGIITARSGIEVSGIVTARAGFAVTYYGDGSNLTGVVSGIALSEGGASRGTEVTTLNFASGATITNTGAGATITISASGITTTAQTPATHTTVTLDLDSANHHEITLVAGISTFDCAGGSAGDSHSVIINQPSSGIATVGFTTSFLFPSGSIPTMSEGGGSVDLLSFVVKKVGLAGTELLASAGLNYSN